MSAPTLNGIRALSVRLIFFWRGVWLADVALDPDVVTTAPSSGPAVLVVGGSTFTGTIDPRGSNTFTNLATARVIGGAGGWDNAVPAQHFHSPSGVLSTQVYSATAAVVAEKIADPTPIVFGADFVRTAGAASRVFDDRDWYVDPVTAITNVAPWPPATLDPSATLAMWDGLQQRGEIATDTVILPGTVLADQRFNGATYTVRDVEQVFDREGGRATVWCSSQPVSRLQGMLTAIVREYGRTAQLKSYRYRFVLPVAGDYSTMALQAITPGASDLNPISQWAGLSGLRAKIAPGTEIVVGLTADNPAVPFILSYSPLSIPIEVDIAGGANFLTPAPWAAALQIALTAFATTSASATTAAQIAAAASTLLTALGVLPASTTILTRAT